MNDFIKRFEELFDREISSKNSWGKNEILRVKDIAIKKALLEIVGKE